MQAKATALFLLFATLACRRETAPQQVLNPLGKTYRTGDDVRAAQVVWRQQPDASRCTSTFSGVLIGEAVIAFVLAQALIDKFGGDSIASLDAAVDRYRAVLAR